MKRQLWMVSFSIGASVLAAQAWAQAPGDTDGADAGSGSAATGADGTTTGSASGSAAGSDAEASGSGAGSAKNDAAKENLKAQGSLPQLTAARGGSFGIPSSIQTSGLHAAVDAQLFDDKSNTDAFAELTSLPITSQVTVDVVGQSVTQDVQRFVLSGDTVRPELYVASLSSAGARVRIRGKDVLVVSHLQSQECLDALAATVPDMSGEQVSLLRLMGDGGLGVMSTDDKAPDTAPNTKPSDDKNAHDTKPGPEDPNPDEKQQTVEQQLKPLVKAQQDQAAAKAKLDEAQKVVDGLAAQKTNPSLVAVTPEAVQHAQDALDTAKKDYAAATEKVRKEQADTTVVTAMDRDGMIHTFRASLMKRAVDRAKRSCKVSEIKGLSGRTLTFGLHALRRASNEKDGKASVGGALELMYQRDNLNRTAFGGVSFEYLNRAVDKDSGAQFDYVSFHAIRLSAGYEYRGSHTTDGTDLLPRVGVYGVASYGWWHDKYTFASAGGTIDQDVHSTELEAGLYAGGKFTNNFTGILALRVLKPFGDFNQGTTFIISLIPAVSAGK